MSADLLMPPSAADWLPEDHLGWFVLDVVAELDLTDFYSGYRADGRGGAAYDPAVMLARCSPRQIPMAKVMFAFGAVVVLVIVAGLVIGLGYVVFHQDPSKDGTPTDVCASLNDKVNEGEELDDSETRAFFDCHDIGE